MLFHPEIKPPYYAVIFSNQLSDDNEGYAEMAELMSSIAQKQKGFLGMDSTRNATGMGITVSYWQDQASIQEWKQEVEHLTAQRLGRERWYADYHLHVAKIERSYSLATSSFEHDK